jgi:hypothetical protein
LRARTRGPQGAPAVVDNARIVTQAIEVARIGQAGVGYRKPAAQIRIRRQQSIHLGVHSRHEERRDRRDRLQRLAG